MAHLDWKAKSPVEVSLLRENHPEREHLLTIRMDPSHWAQWARILGELLIDPNPNAELKSEWPSGWTIYWKNREEESRVLLAHPEESLWVATVAWNRSEAGSLREALGPQGAGQGVSLFDFQGISFLSNLEIRFELLQG